MFHINPQWTSIMSSMIGNVFFILWDGQHFLVIQKVKVKFGTHWFLSYHRLLDVIHMVTLTHFLEGNPLPPHRLLFSISSKGSFICTFPIDRTVHTTAFDKPVVDHWFPWSFSQTMISSLHCFVRPTTENLHMIHIQKLNAITTNIWMICATLNSNHPKNLTSHVMKLLVWSTSRKEMTL